jgi:PUA-domain protein
MRRAFLSKRETRALLGELRALGFRGEPQQVERVEMGDAEVFLAGGKPLCFRRGGKLYPSLHWAELFQLKKVVVDLGAVPHLLKGADVMAPGIVKMEELKEGELVFVVDEKYGKPLVVGISLLTGGKPERGKVVRNIHRVGDEIWRIGSSALTIQPSKVG